MGGADDAEFLQSYRRTGGHREKNTKHEYAVDFKLAVPLCKAFLSDANSDEINLLREIARNTEPIRYDRHSERKLRAKGFFGFCYRVAA